MAHKSGPTNRNLFPSHGAGKGDAERSPGWRDNYPDIQWPPRNTEGFIRIRAGRIRKIYR